MLKKIVMVLLALFLALLGLEKTYDHFLLKNRNLKTTRVMRDPIDADVIFLGPCEPLWMMNPETFHQKTGLTAYNLSTVHANFAENLLMLNLYLKASKPPKFLFLYATGESVDGGFNVFNTFSFAHLLRDTGVAAAVCKEDPDYSRYSRIPFMRYAYYNDYVNFNMLQGIKHSLSGRDTAYFPDGYVPPHGITWDGRLEQFMHTWPHGRSFDWNPKEVKDLMHLIDRCKALHIRLVLYESPMLNEIKPWLKNRDEIRRKITTLAEEKQIPYWVFDTMRISDSRRYFFSVLNTNDKGNIIFNEVFASYFNASFLKPKPSGTKEPD